MNKILQYMSNGTLEHEYELSYDNLKKCNGMMSKIHFKNGNIKEMYLNAFDDETEDIINLWLIINDEVVEETVSFKEIVNVESILYSHPRWGHKPYLKFEFTKSNKENKNDDFFDDDGIPKIFKNGTPLNQKKCPKCGRTLIDIIYGLPDSDTFEKAEKNEVKLGGCEVTDFDPKYYCSNCNISYYEDLEEYIEDKTYFYIYVEYIDMPGDRLYCYKSENRNIKKDDIVLVDRAGEEVFGKVINIKEYTQKTAPYPPFLTKDILEVHNDKTVKNIVELHTRRTDLLKAHDYSFRNRKQLEKDKKCGCFHCCKIFNPKDIKEWCDEADTAICPYCGIDSVIGESSGFPINEKFLNDMKKHWF